MLKRVRGCTVVTSWPKEKIDKSDIGKKVYRVFASGKDIKVIVGILRGIQLRKRLFVYIVPREDQLTDPNDGGRYHRVNGVLWRDECWPMPSMVIRKDYYLGTVINKVLLNKFLAGKMPETGFGAVSFLERKG